MYLKSIIPSAIALLMLVSCNNNVKVKNDHDSSVVTDSPVREVYSKASSDSIRNGKSENKKNGNTENPDGDVNEIYAEYVSNYKKPCLIDSSFVIDGNKYVIDLSHYCLMDSAVVVPKKYVYMYKLDSFLTHNFVTKLSIKKDNKTIVERTISKKDFEKFLYPQLKQYGVLFCPALKISNGFFTLDYSISIPLTDVGVGTSAQIDHNGNIHFKGE